MKKKILIITGIIVLIAAIVAVVLFVVIPSDKKLAEQHLQKAEILFNARQYNAAKLQIDTINTVYRREIEVREKSKSIANKIQVIELDRTINYTDSLLRIKRAELDSLDKNMVLEINEKYETEGKYVYKQQKLSGNSARTFIKAMVQENGEFMLMSSYAGGKALKHNAMKFSAGDLFVETQPIPDSNYQNSFESEGTVLETTMYKGTDNKAIATFVQENMAKTITVTLEGSEGKTTFTLTPTEKKAISECYNFSVVLSDIKNLERINKTSKKKIEIYRK